jgi:hypothetical protein
MPGRETHALKRYTHNWNRHGAPEQPFRMVFNAAASSGRRASPAALVTNSRDEGSGWSSKNDSRTRSVRRP